MQADIYFFLMTRLIHHSVFFFHLFLFFLYFFILEFWNMFSVLFFCFLLCYSAFCSLCLLFNSFLLFFLCSLSCYLPLCWFPLFSNDPPYSLNCSLFRPAVLYFLFSCLDLILYFVGLSLAYGYVFTIQSVPFLLFFIFLARYFFDISFALASVSVLFILLLFGYCVNISSVINKHKNTNWQSSIPFVKVNYFKVVCMFQTGFQTFDITGLFLLSLAELPERNIKKISKALEIILLQFLTFYFIRISFNHFIRQDVMINIFLHPVAQPYNQLNRQIDISFCATQWMGVAMMGG